MNFASDNWSGVAFQINDSLVSNANGSAAAYGDSELDEKVKAKFCEIFEKDVAVFFVGTGSIANSLSMAAWSKPGGISLCHREAHMIEDECGAPELYSGGGRLVGVDGNFGKMDLEDLKAKLSRFDPNFVHYGQATAISITQATEAGTVYSLEEIQTISKIAKANSLPMHMDGSRFANALVNLDVSPAQMTWKSGIDILSFGGTKNGCWCAEAIVMFDPSMADQMAYAHKRAGQLYSKSRFIAAQYDAYFKDDLWLDLAGHANNMADRLREGISISPNARLGWPTQSNEVFCILPRNKAKLLQDKGAKFYQWHVPVAMKDKPQTDEELYRFVTSFATRVEEIDQVVGELD
ncbi:MAG: low specificity L-threonine aldolase [Hyphomicrobiales bacterium]|nr:low specificity L-threonine aldolase [Hyphomicrobiales bacterium]